MCTLIGVVKAALVERGQDQAGDNFLDGEPS